MRRSCGGRLPSVGWVDYSIVFALLFLSAAFALIGPERKQGELAVLARSVFANHGPKQVTPE